MCLLMLGFNRVVSRAAIDIKAVDTNAHGLGTPWLFKQGPASDRTKDHHGSIAAPVLI
jgi:hypothetical protein